MNTLCRTFLVALALLVYAPAVAADKPTAEQVKGIALEAAKLLSRVGVDKARPVLNAEGPFKFGEVYVNVIDTNGSWLIYPPSPRNEGKSVLNVRDADGKLLVQEIIALALEKGEGWVEYRWLNPVSNRIEPKLSYVKLVPDIPAITYVGVYK